MRVVASLLRRVFSSVPDTLSCLLEDAALSFVHARGTSWSTRAELPRLRGPRGSLCGLAAVSPPICIFPRFRLRVSPLLRRRAAEALLSRLTFGSRQAIVVAGGGSSPKKRRQGLAGLFKTRKNKRQAEGGRQQQRRVRLLAVSCYGRFCKA